MHFPSKCPYVLCSNCVALDVVKKTSEASTADIMDDDCVQSTSRRVPSHLGVATHVPRRIDDVRQGVNVQRVHVRIIVVDVTGRVASCET